jgi:benzoyl-CoA 2,3-dioxygenase component B
LEIDTEMTLPDLRFNRNQGVHSTQRFTPSGEPISDEEFLAKRDEWLPTTAERDYVRSCMVKVYEPGKIANWIAPPASGIDDKPFEFEYVKFH